MEIPPTPFWPLALLSGLLTAALAYYVWTRRETQGARTIFAALTSAALVCVTAALEGSSGTLAGHIAWLHVQVLGYAAVPVCWLLMVCDYVGKPISQRKILLLSLPAGAGVLMHWTDQWLHLYWSRVWVENSGPIAIMGRSYGPGFWIWSAFNYSVITAGVVLLIRNLPVGRLQRRRSFILLGALAIPLLANFAYLLNLGPVRHLDITPYVMATTCGCMVWALFRYRLKGIVPIAARSVVDSMADGVVVLDLDQRVAAINPAAEDLLGCAPSEAAGCPASEIFRDCPQAEHFYKGEGAVSGDMAVRRSDGERRCAVRASDVSHGPVRIGRVVTLHDVTAERSAAEQLHQAQQAAEAASIAKSRFLANMSHEIRTPMNAVLGVTELLRETKLDTEQLELVVTAQESANFLLSILNEILDFSKIEAGGLILERIDFNLPELAKATVGLLEPAAARKGIDLLLTIDPSTPRGVCGDPTRLRQVLQNLTSNAVKFTSKGTVAVVLRAELCDNHRARVQLSVDDTGIGIAPERLASLFDEFTQADTSVSRRFGGTGLGLAISKRVVEQMGGAIHVESVLGHGSRFVAELPLDLSAKAPDERPPQTTGLVRQFPGFRVLLAEDNPVNQVVCRKILERLGCEVAMAADGVEVLAMLELTSYELILMDVHMPEMDGLEATRELRRRAVSTPIVALTASALDETRQTCEAAGMNGFITKPVRIEELAEVMARHYQPRTSVPR